MASKLRPLYDKLYIRGEAIYNGIAESRGCRARAAAAESDPRADTEYQSVIRPYWRQFRVRTPKKYWFLLYCAGSNPFSPKYIPEDLWFRDIVPHYNNLIFAKALQDKCLFGLLFPGIRQPETLLRRMAGVYTDGGGRLLTEAEAAACCRGEGRVIAKPSVSTGQGRGIRFFDSDSMTEEELRELLNSFGQNYIIQKKLSQHPALAALNPRSVNTVRVMTFLHGNEVRILSSILRIGGGDNEVDNVSRGGYQCTIRPDGRLEPTAITKQSGQWVRVSETAGGISFADVTVPSYDRILDAVRAAAGTMGHFRLLGWDIAVDPEGEPVLIEYNVIPGQNQSTCGPTFGALTDEVLEEVYGRRRRP